MAFSLIDNTLGLENDLQFILQLFKLQQGGLLTWRRSWADYIYVKVTRGSKDLQLNWT